MTGTPSDPAFWTAAYRDRTDRWELGSATPPLERFFDAFADAAGLRIDFRQRDLFRLADEPERRPGGPPFSVDEAELRRLFSPHFVITNIEVPPDSVPHRRGEERLVQLRRRDP